MYIQYIYITNLPLSLSIWLLKSHTVGRLSCYTTVYCESALSICTAQNCDYFSLLQGGRTISYNSGGGSVTKKS